MTPPATAITPPENARGTTVAPLAGVKETSRSPASASQTSAGPAVVVQGLHKSYGEQKVLNGLDLKVGSGQTVAVLGRSGTGKSVLLRLIVGLQKPDAGTIQLQGQEITGANLEEMNEIRKKIGFLFQHAALYDSLTVEENIAFPLRRHTEMTAAQRSERIRELLASVGMDRDLDKMPSELSGGMQKRVGLARALALDPDILLFDEPTAGLDPITAAEIGDLIVDLKKKRKMTAVVVTHDIHGARTFADRLILLREGEIAVEGTFADLQKSKDDFVVKFLKNAC